MVFSSHISSFLLRHGRQVALLSTGTGLLLEYERSSSRDMKGKTTKCDAEPSRQESSSTTTNSWSWMTPTSTTKDSHSKSTSSSEEEWYADLFPKRHLFVPTKEYPLWDANWDQKQPKSFMPNNDDNNDDNTVDANSAEKKEQQRKLHREIHKYGTTRHIILVRHGQYDETYKEDHTRILTPLGREQADLTGKRIAEMIRGCQDADLNIINNNSKSISNNDTNATDATSTPSPCNVRVMHVSNLARAKETAEIIASHLPPQIQCLPPDPLLNEARPCQTIPGSKATPSSILKTEEGNEQVEAAFRKYFYRSDYDSPETTMSTTTASIPPTEYSHRHEFEIIVCHANVIRYFTCRALQLPPEAWLRFCNFNCSLTYLTIRPTGSVSCRMFGDVGHLPFSKCTFSQHLGFNW